MAAPGERKMPFSEISVKWRVIICNQIASGALVTYAKRLSDETPTPCVSSHPRFYDSQKQGKSLTALDEFSLA